MAAADIVLIGEIKTAVAEIRETKIPDAEISFNLSLSLPSLRLQAAGC